MFNKLYDKFLDRMQFNRQIGEKFGITKSEAKALKDLEGAEFLVRMLEKMKLEISVKSLMSTTKEGIQRRNNWIETLNYIQSFLQERPTKEKKIDFLTMKKK
jgi:parvulin-like peptidyl-prolyl isomerase